MKSLLPCQGPVAAAQHRGACLGFALSRAAGSQLRRSWQRLSPPKGPQGRYYPGSPRGRGWPWQLEVLRIKPSELPDSGACAQTGEQLPKLQVPGEPQCFDTWTSTTAPQSGMGKSCQVPAPCQEFRWFCSHVLPCISCVQLLTQGCSGKVQS